MCIYIYIHIREKNAQIDEAVSILLPIAEGKVTFRGDGKLPSRVLAGSPEKWGGKMPTGVVYPRSSILSHLFFLLPASTVRQPFLPPDKLCRLHFSVLHRKLPALSFCLVHPSFPTSTLFPPFAVVSTHLGLSSHIEITYYTYTIWIVRPPSSAMCSYEPGTVKRTTGVKWHSEFRSLSRISPNFAWYETKKIIKYW